MGIIKFEVQLWLENAQCGNISQSVINAAKKTSPKNTYINTPTKPEFGKKNNIMAWNGKRPYCGAMVEYHKYMSNIVDDMIIKLETNKSYSYIEVKHSFDDKFGIIMDSGDIKTYSWECVHYGPIMQNNDYSFNIKTIKRKRDTPWLKIGYLEHPFAILQKKYSKLGYVLTDNCDEHTKVSRIRINKFHHIR